MTICRTIKKTLAFCVVFSFGMSNIMAQKEYHLGAKDCAIVAFHILDDQFCASTTMLNIFDSTPYTYNIFLCNIDSIMTIHSVGGYVDVPWFNKVNFILIDDTIQLKADSIYMGSVEVEFDMDYVVLNTIIERDSRIVDKNDGHPRPSGFLCECDMPNTKALSICENYKKMIIERIEQYKKYKNQK